MICSSPSTVTEADMNRADVRMTGTINGCDGRRWGRDKNCFLMDNEKPPNIDSEDENNQLIMKIESSELIT